MFAKILIGLFVFTSLLSFLPQRIDADDLQIITSLTPQEYISIYATQFNVSEKQLLVVASCESNLKPTAFHKNDGGKGKHSIGIFQFQESTFLTWEKKLGENLDYYSYQDQAKLAAFMFSQKQQSQWTCWNMNKKRLSAIQES